MKALNPESQDWESFLGLFEEVGLSERLETSDQNAGGQYLPCTGHEGAIGWEGILLLNPYNPALAVPNILPKGSRPHRTPTFQIS